MSKRKIIVIFSIALVLLGIAVREYRALPAIDIAAAKRLGENKKVLILIRHGERCDRSANKCLGDKKGITINGASKAKTFGEKLSQYITSYYTYSTDTVRTIQTARLFTGSKPFIASNLGRCDKEIYKKFKALMTDKIKPVILFTHNHCLSFIAKDMSGSKFKPSYLDAIVLHIDENKFYLDGQLKL